MPLVFAASGGSAVFAVIIVLFVLGLAYTAYSKRGGGIDAHPLGTDPPDSSGDEVAGRPDHDEFRQRFDEHGSR